MWLEKVGKDKEGVIEDETTASLQRVMSNQSYVNPVMSTQFTFILLKIGCHQTIEDSMLQF